MVDLVEHLGVVSHAEGLRDGSPISWCGLKCAPVELIGSGLSLTLLPLSTVAGVVTLAIGVTGNIDHLIQLVEGMNKNVSWFLLQSSSVVLQPEAQNEKVETFGLIIDLVLLRMESSGNLTQ